MAKQDAFAVSRAAKPVFAFLAIFALVFCVNRGWAQMSTDAYATKYFLDEAPSAVDRSKLPPTAQDVIVARVRIVEDLRYLVPEHENEYTPPPPKDLFMAPVEILHVLAGSAAIGKRYEMYFGFPGVGQMKYPHTPNQTARQYFIVSYLGDDGIRRLVGYPISQQEYREWSKDVWDYERMRGRPGARDQ